MIDDQTIAPPSPSAAFLSHLTLLPMQERFVHAGERFSCYVGGVGAGKSTAGAVRALARALAAPGSLGLIGAPTYPMLRDATQRTVFELLDLLGAGYARSYHKSEGRLTLENGSEILLRSMDEPDRVRGLNLAWFWLDEAPLCGYYAWQILKGRLRQRGYATAGWATGTPRGRDGFWRDFEHAPRPHHALYRASTHANAANLPPDYISDLGLTGALYDQEVLGLFTAFAGLVYAFTSDASDGNVRAPDAGKGWKDVIGGVDWGYTHPSAALVFGVDGDGRAWQLAEYYQRRAPLDAEVIPAILDLTRRYGVRTWYGGPDEPEHLAALRTALLRAELPCRVLPGDDAVRPGIQTVTKLLARREDGTRGLSVAPSCVNTIAEYGAYQWAPEPVSLTGLLPLAAGRDAAAAYAEVPLKVNDDAMDATRYALHTALGRAHPAQAAWDACLLMRERARDRERDTGERAGR
ncbi:MAG TPA: phage terminase large subunit [Ktedonobacterales bacterium]|nr:phage terminase large subunit [Ktedonobacterales bacterium]